MPPGRCNVVARCQEGKSRRRHRARSRMLGTGGWRVVGVIWPFPFLRHCSRKVSPVCCRTLFGGSIGQFSGLFYSSYYFCFSQAGTAVLLAANSQPRSYTTGLRHGPSTSRRCGTAPPASRPDNEALGATGTMARDAGSSSHSDLLSNSHGFPQHGRPLNGG